MALNAKKIKTQSKGPQQEAMEAGTYPARVVQVIDLGVQPQRAYDGQSKPPIQQVRITYEFVDEFCLDEDGKELEDKPRWLSEDIPLHPLSADLAKSTKRYKAIDPDDVCDGDFTQLPNFPCNVTITATEGKGKNAGNVYNNIASVNSMRKRDADKCAPLVNDVLTFAIDEPTQEAWDKLPNWLQDKIKEGIEFGGSATDKMINGGGDEPKKQPAPDGDGNGDAGGNDNEKGADKPW